jgi:hypothetical protein
VDRPAVEFLQQVEHRAVFVVEQPWRHDHAVVGGDADEILIERAVVDAAQADAVRDDGVAEWVEITRDVRAPTATTTCRPTASSSTTNTG